MDDIISRINKEKTQLDGKKSASSELDLVDKIKKSRVSSNRRNNCSPDTDNAAIHRTRSQAGTATGSSTYSTPDHVKAYSSERRNPKTRNQQRSQRPIHNVSFGADPLRVDPRTLRTVIDPLNIYPNQKTYTQSSFPNYKSNSSSRLKTALFWCAVVGLTVGFGGYYLFTSGKKDYRKPVQKDAIERTVTTPSPVSPTPQGLDFLLDDDYQLAVVEKDMQIPYTVSPEAMRIGSKLRHSTESDLQKARDIFDYFEKELTYGDKRRTRGVGYRSSEEVFKSKEGVCGELAYAYITAARLAGLESKWVEVKYDFKGDKVAHACASVKINGRYILVDPAYHAFDIPHKRYEILDDNQTTDLFQRMRRN